MSNNKPLVPGPAASIHIARRGLMLVLSSPSGAGKTTIARRLLEMDADLHLSVSVTTRQRRPGEVHGRDYSFISNEEFGLMVNRQELLEHAKVFDHYYGTPREAVEKRLSSGQDVLFDIDWQGTQQLRQRAESDLVSVFILPPSTADLERRLHSRAQDSPEVVAKRMSKAADEISHWAEYDYIVINDDVEQCLMKVYAILQAERLKRHRGLGLVDFVKQLREGR
ncbi:MAG TPA: guanylate kinase [Ferrovibrio sp.]|jgi:guanylate kinase|uniref:guanylate kinase n=1 Tax=Ferrovibrio sp. TaxID=1917215 RepID=UPI002B4ABE5C|nr:guanylate kinase [Ferrovibrio sp.]HLT78197.1 guanylate kinase [Ferrovibrio sp.]